VKLLGKQRIAEFQRKHPASRAALNNWVDIVESVIWKTHADLKSTFPSADYVKPYYVFNIAGNNWRIIAIVTFFAETVIVEHVITHKEYDKWKP